MADQTIDTTAAQKSSKGFKAIGKDASGNLGYINSTPVIVPTVTGTAATDTAAINSALLNGNVHVLIVGDVTINAPLVVYSNTHLELSPGSSITFPATTGPMLYNRSAFNPQRTVSDVEMTAGLATITSATAAFDLADVGRSVVVDDAGAQGKWAVSPFTVVGGPLCADIVSVESATSATLEFPAQQTVSGKTAKIYDRDKNIKLSGGHYSFTGVGNPEDGKTRGIGNTRMMNFFRRVDGLVVDNVNLHNTTWAKYALNLGDVRHARISNITFDTATDGLHIRGPARDIKAKNLTGYTGDDFTAITATDNIVYSDIQGDVEDVVFEGIDGDTPHNHFKFVSSTGTKARNITARNYTNTKKNGVLKLSVFDDPLCGLGVGTRVEALLIENWTADKIGLGLTSTGGGDATIRNINTIGTKTDDTYSDTLYIGGAFDLICISGLLSLTNSYHLNGITMFGALGSVRIQDFHYTYAPTDTASRLINVYGSVNYLNISEAYSKYGGILQLRPGSNVGRIDMDDIKDDASDGIGVFETSTRLNLTNVSRKNKAYVGIYIAPGNTLDLSGSNYDCPDLVGDDIWPDGNSICNIRFPDYPIAHNAHFPAIARGAAYNVDSGAAIGVGPIISTGAGWKNLYTPE